MDRRVYVSMAERAVRLGDKLDDSLGTHASRIALQDDTSKGDVRRVAGSDRQNDLATDNRWHAAPDGKDRVHAFDMQVPDLHRLFCHQLEPLFRGERHPPGRRSFNFRPAARQVERRSRTLERSRHVGSVAQMRQKLLQCIADLTGRSLPEFRYCRPESVCQGCCQLPEHIAQPLCRENGSA